MGKVLSLAFITRVAKQSNESRPFDSLELALIFKRMPALLEETKINPQVSIEHDEARVNLSILNLQKDLSRKALLDQIHPNLSDKQLGIGPGEAQLSGLLVLYNNMLQSLFRSQVLTLDVVMLGVALMLLVLFRSISLAISAIILNALSAVIILGVMGLLQILFQEALIKKVNTTSYG